MNAVVGAKKGSNKQRQPVISPDSAQSKTFIKVLYGLAEGEIEGLANGLQSIYLEETQLQNADGSLNFENVKVDFRNGTNDQEYIEGFPAVENETAIDVELKSETPWVRAFSNLDLDAVRLRLKWGPLRTQNATNGDVSGVTIEYAIDLQTDGGVWTEVLKTKISDKTSDNYERPHRIDLPKADSGWLVRVRRITPNSTSEYISDKMYVKAVTEVIDAKLRYPNTALVSLQYDAETFGGSVAKLAVDLKGVKIKVPTNYNPETREYVGMWDGTFKRAYSNNPAWIYYDLCTSKRYGIGERITDGMLDKWSLYRLAQYCDELVPDGLGGQEPRFTCNIYLQSAEDAYSILTKLAGVFRAITYWDGDSIVCDADIPQDTYFTYTRANIIGEPDHNGTRARDRHNAVKVAWDNPANHYKTEYEFVRDEKAISEMKQVRLLELDAWGCTSRGQAQRAGLWALKSEQLETRTVTFKVGLDGHIPLPGKVIEFADPIFAGRANGGRISAISADRKSITLDRDDVVAVAGDRLIINGENGKAQTRIIQSITGRVITVTVAFDEIAPQNVWVIDAQDLATLKFRVLSVVQSDSHQFTITALEYNPKKFDAIDKGAHYIDVPISIVNPNIQEPVSNIVITSEDRVDQGINVATMVVSWTQAKGAVKYQVEWRKDDGSWIKLPITGNNSIEVPGIYAGNYEARVTAISAFDVASLPTYSILTTLSGKQGLPPALANIAATGILFGYRLNWNFPATGALDTAYTEIEIASTANGANAAQLGLFAYPTDSHVIQGMQPNLTRYFRGRLIDRIGNIGPWSQYASATTSADASAVLDILSGKITESQLHQDLQTKIDRIDTVDSDIADIVQAVQGVEDGLTQERTERQSGDQDVLNQLTIYKVSNDQAVAAVVEEVEILTTEQGALSTKIDGVFAQVNPPLIGSESDLIGNNAGYAGVWSEQSARIESDLAQAIRTDTVQTDLNGNKAAVQEVTKSVNGLYAQKFIKLDVNGKIAGWGGANDGVESQFIFNFDSIAIGNGSNTAVTYPYIFRTTSFTDPVTGTVFPPAAYLKSAMMDYQSVKTSHIEDLAVKTAKIGDAAITNAKIDNLSVSTLKIQDEAVTVPSGIINQSERKFYFAVSNSMAGSVAYTQDLVTLNVETQGGKLRIDGSFVFDCKVRVTRYSSSYDIMKCVTLACRVLVNGTVVYTQEIYPTFYDGSSTVRYIGVTATPVYILPPSTGTKTIVLQLAYITKNNNIDYGSFQAQAGFADTPTIITMASLSTLELKK
ncbi:phage tail family protein [Acinetobacter baumannii]|uniref:host specificity protein J n=1 Tax=Acinetobacter baumannii TaxID=470 RepID=UPI00066D5499|nr:phage tail protein [Acinetobacter baumannii]KMV06659.1 phage tail family protein [Acinetobacter baumannii]